MYKKQIDTIRVENELSSDSIASLKKNLLLSLLEHKKLTMEQYNLAIEQLEE